MLPKDENLLRRLRAAFKDEAREHVHTIASGLVSLENAEDGARGELLENIFRAAHSLKGAARTVSIPSIESVCQSLESVFAELRSHRLEQTPELFDLLQQTAGALGKLLPANADSPVVPLSEETHVLLRSLNGLLGSSSQTSRASARRVPEQKPAAAVATPAPEATETPVKAANETVRVSAARLEVMMGWAEELLAVRLAAAEQTRALRSLAMQPEVWRKRSTRARDAARAGASSIALKAASASRVAEFEEWNETFHAELESKLLELSRVAGRDERMIGTLTDHLLDELKEVTLQPCSTLLDIFPMTVREIARGAGKEVELTLKGREMELDRRILDELKDPLIHIVRNCIDHGIEAPAAREAAGKPRRGKISISVTPRNGTSVEIEVTDDGAGIDPARVRAAATEAGRFSEEQLKLLSDEDAKGLIFESGLSTSQQVSDLSGRGLGLAIVRRKVELLDGSVSVASERGQGSTFRLLLPVTLARFRGLVIRMGTHLFVLPTRNVASVARVNRDEVKTVENRPTVALRDETIAVASLGETIGLPVTAGDEPSLHLFLVIITSENHRIAFAVDEILYEDEVVVKSLGYPLKRVRHISSATALGNGRVAAILHASDLVASAMTSDTLPIALAHATHVGPKKRSILVAEDSITSRTLLRTILESAGYNVETAADGVEAFSKLRSGHFDAVVSDVDMPRLNGFGLTARIRGDRRLEGLPVVLVTALEKPEDREHGIDVGATAYLIKSSFDQSNLLQVLSRLL